jgi:hypothetical protein
MGIGSGCTRASLLLICDSLQSRDDFAPWHTLVLGYGTED